MDFVKRLLIHVVHLFLSTTITNSSLDSRRRDFPKKNRFYITTFELEFEKNDNKLDSKLFQPRLSVSVCRHSFTRKNTFLSLNKTRERSGRVNSFSAAAARRLSHYYYSPSPQFRVRIPKPSLEFTRNVLSDSRMKKFLCDGEASIAAAVSVAIERREPLFLEWEVQIEDWTRDLFDKTVVFMPALITSVSS